MGPAERQQPGLVGLQVDAGRRCDARRGKAVPGTEVRKGGFQLLGTRPPAAADAQHPDAGHQMQSVPGRGESKGKIGFGGGPCRIHPGGRGALHGKLSGKPHRLPGQQLAADMLDALRFQHRAVLVLCPLVHRKNAVGVGGRGDHRNGSAHGGQCTGQVIGTAQMTGQHRHRKAAAFVQYHHRRVRRLAAAVRRNGPHRNAHGSHKNKGVALRKLQGGPPGKGDAAAAAAVHTAGQGVCQPPGQCQTGVGKGQIGPGH